MLKTIFFEAAAPLRFANHFGMIWGGLTAFLAVLANTVASYQTAILALYCICILDMAIGGYRHAKEGTWSSKRFWGRAAEKVIGLSVLLIGSALLGVAAPIIQDYTLSGVIAAFALKEVASLAYNMEKAGIYTLPKAIKDRLTQPENEHPADSPDPEA